jgi:hypothetical protein
VLGEEGVEIGEAGRRRPGVVVAQAADETVDLTDRLPRDLLDRLQRRAGAGGVALLEQPGGARLDADDVDRVAGGVVQVAGDPRALLGAGAGLELGDLLVAQAGALAGESRDHPDECPDRDRGDRELPAGDAQCRRVDGEQPGDCGRRARGPRVRVIATDGQQVHGDRRPDRHAARIPEGGERGARHGHQREHAQRRSPPRDERER